MWEILSDGKLPFGEMDNSEVIDLLKAGQVLPLPESRLSEEFTNRIYKICLKCWQSNPTERPSFDDLIKLFKSLEKELNLLVAPEATELQVSNVNSNNSEHYGNYFVENRMKMYTSWTNVRSDNTDGSQNTEQGEPQITAMYGNQFD